MAVLTWRNVDAPNLSSATRTMLAAGGAFNDAVSGARGMIADRKKEGSETASREVLANALALTDADGYDAALRDGSIFGNADRSQVSADTYNTLFERSKSLIGNQGDRLRNTNQGIINDTNQYSLGRTQFLNNRSDAEYAARPEIEQVLTQAEGMIMSGNPEQVAAGRKIIEDRAGDIQRAGYNPSALLRGSIASASSGRQEQLNVYEHGNKVNDINVSEGVRGVVDKAFSDYPGNPQAALKSIQDNRNLSREEVAAATDLVGKIPPEAWGTAPSGTLAKYGIGDANALAPRPSQAAARYSSIPYGNNTFGNHQGRYVDTIRRSAEKYNIDPDVALRVAQSEGGVDGWVQSNVKKGSDREPSYGPFQMLVGGKGTNFPAGMGNDFIRDTGLDPRDERNAEAVIDYAMNRASKEGWSAWYGAANKGISKNAGIGGRPSDVSPNLGGNNFPQATQMLADTNPFINQAEGYSPQATLEGMFGRDRPVEFTPDTPIPSVEDPTVQAPEVNPQVPVEAPIATPDNPFAAIDFANDQALSGEINAAQMLQDTINQQRIDQAEAAKGTNAGTRENIARAVESNMVDSAFGDSPYMTEYIRTRPDRGKSKTQIIKEVAEDTGIDPLAVTEAINQLTRDNGLGLGSKRIEPDMAGALIRESTEARDLRGDIRRGLEGIPLIGEPIGTFNSWFSTPSDEWGKGNGQAKALRVDMDKLANNLSRFQNTNADGVSTSPNASPLAQDRITAEAQAQVQVLDAERAEVEAWYRQELARIDAGIRTGAATPADRAALTDQMSKVMMAINQKVEAIQSDRNPYRYHNRE